jgi:hypothetical protein
VRNDLRAISAPRFGSIPRPQSIVRKSAERRRGLCHPPRQGSVAVRRHAVTERLNFRLTSSRDFHRT